MVDSRTNFAKEISALLRETYGSKIKVFVTEIPHSVRAKEISAEGNNAEGNNAEGNNAEGNNAGDQMLCERLAGKTGKLLKNIHYNYKSKNMNSVYLLLLRNFPGVVL